MTYLLVIAWLSLGIVSLLAMAWAVVHTTDYPDTEADLLVWERTERVMLRATAGLVLFALWTLLIALGHFECLTGGAS